MLSAFAYSDAFLYERGYALAFGVPPELIDLRWATFFGLAFSFGLTLLAFGFMVVLSRKSPRRDSKWSRVVDAVAPVLLIEVIAVFILGFARWRLLLIFFALGLATTSLLETALWLVRSRAIGGDSQTKDEAVRRALFRQPRWMIRALFLLGLSLPVAMFAGFGNAIDTTDFLVTSDSPPSVVVRVYGDKIVTAQYDRQAKAIIPVYRILPLTDSARVLTLVHFAKVMPVCPPVTSEGDWIPVKTLRRYLGEEFASYQERCLLNRKLRTPASLP